MGKILDLAIPPRCAACAVPARGLCQGCRFEAQSLRLPSGGAVLLSPDVAAVGVYAYDGVIRDAVRGMKLAGRHGAAAEFATQIRELPALPQSWPVTWVPSTRRRQRQRGFDLPRLLAGTGAVPLLQRTFEGPDQTELSSEQRRTFPADAFRPVASVRTSVVLIDDVRTTGATALAAASALLQAGADRVLVATLAVGGDTARRAAG